MKKKLTLLALGSLLLAGGSTLASCKGDGPSTSSGDISSTTQEVSYTVKVTTPEEKKAWFAQYFDGEIGASGFKLKEGVDSTITLTGFYAIGGDGNYWSPTSSNAGHNGYLVADEGVYMYLHQADTSMAEKIQQEVVTGAKIKVTGTMTVYNNLPQITGYTYELVQAAPQVGSDDWNKLVDDLFYEVTTKEDFEKINTSANIEGDYEWALRPVRFTQMVNTKIITGSDLSSYCPLSYVATSEKENYTIQIYRPGGVSSEAAGQLWDIYGAVTAYRGAPQLNVGNVKDQSVTLKGLQSVKASSLTSEQKLALANLRTDFTYGGTITYLETASDDSYGEIEGTSRLNLRLYPTLEGVETTFELAPAGDDNDNDLFEIALGPASMRYLDFKKELDSEGVNREAAAKVSALRAEADKKYTVKLIKTFVIDGGAPASQELVYTFDIVEQAVNSSLNRDFGAGALPNYVTYITNNESYPNPSFETADGITGIKLYTKGGFSTEPLISDNEILVSDFGTLKVKAIGLDRDAKAGKFTVTLYDSTNTVLGVAEQEITSAEITAGKYVDYALNVKWNENVNDKKVSYYTLINNETGGVWNIYVNSVTYTPKA